MKEQRSRSPSGLTRMQYTWLAEQIESAAQLSVQQLLEVTQCHLHKTSRAYQRNPLVNLRLATAIYNTIHQVAAQWHTLTPAAQPWLAGAILYFGQRDDEEPDFTSPIGFEGDKDNSCYITILVTSHRLLNRSPEGLKQCLRTIV